MKLKIIIIACLMLVQCKSKHIANHTLPIDPVIDTIFGKKIEDQYRYIENSNDSLVLHWYKSQTKFSDKLLSNIPGRNNILELQEYLEKQNNNVISDLKTTSNEIYFYLKTDDSNKTKNLYYRSCFNCEEKLLFNIENYTQNNVINYFNPSWDGSKVVIGITKSDLEIGDLVILDVKSKKIIDQPIHNCWPSALGGIRWLPNNSGFTYEHIPEMNKNSKNYLLNIKTLLHIIGTTSDKILLSKSNNPDIDMGPKDFPEVSFKSLNTNFMFASVSGASYYADHYYSDIKNILSEKIAWKKLFTKENLIKKFYPNEDEIIFMTAQNAQNFKICKTSLLTPDFQSPDILVKEDSDTNSVITDFVLTNKGIFFVKTKNGVDANLYQLNSKGDIIYIPIPKKSGNIDVISKGSNSSDLWIELTGWTTPKTRYKYDFENQAFIENDIYTKSGYDELLTNLVIEEIEVESYDHEKVPLSIIYKKDIKFNGNNPTLISCYGGFGVSIKPALTNYLLHWVNNGGVYAVAHVRGGGEKGDSWHKGGYKKTKPNSWKDLIACTEYLINKNYTNNNKTGIYSASGGGIVLGRALTERPNLFAVAIIRVGIFNTVRSEFAPNGMNLSTEFGTIKDSLEFNYLLEMDSYHKIKKGVKYPAVFLTAGMNDSRVVVWQPAKFAAKLQTSSSSKKPILLSVDFDGGHGLDASKKNKDEELANLLSFAFWQMGHPDYQLKE